MNPKIIGIVLLVVGLGVGLYFMNSGGASRFATLLKAPGSASSTNIASSSTGISSNSSTVSTGQSPSSSSGFSWSSFFQSLFSARGFPTVPTALNTGGGQGGQTYFTGSGSSGSGDSSSASAVAATVTPPSGFTAAQLSPYYQKVRLSGVSSGEISVTIYPAYSTPTSTVDITGWEIKTNHGGEFIPQAMNIYYPTGLNDESDIILALNQINYVNIYSNSAPVNLRLNVCMGYLNKPQQFNPGFSYACPAIDRSQITQFTGACQNYILSLSNCQSPDFSSYYFPSKDYQCQDYLQNKFNYSWCVSTYASAPNFLSNEWRIWMGASPLDPYHDNVKLLDRNGLLVDAYSY